MNKIKFFTIVFFFFSFLLFSLYKPKENLYAQHCSACLRDGTQNSCPVSQSAIGSICNNRECVRQSPVTASCTFMGTTYQCCGEGGETYYLCDPTTCAVTGNNSGTSPVCKCGSGSPGDPGDPIDPPDPGPSCTDQHNLPPEMKPRWLIMPQGTYYENSVIPMKFQAASSSGIREISIELRRSGVVEHVVVCECTTRRCYSEACTLESVVPCPSNSADICNITVNVPDLMPTMKANIVPWQGLFIPWQAKIEVQPKWGQNCSSSAVYEVKDCDPSCPTPKCTINESDCGAEHTLTNTGPNCVAHKAKCEQTTACGDSKVCNEAQCYRVEKNTTPPSSPTNPIMTINGYTYPLATDGTFTRVRKPLPGQPETAVTIGATAPSLTPGTYRNPTFDFTGENLGIGNKWKENPDTCSGSIGEDFCIKQKPQNTISYVGTTLSPQEILIEGSQGTIDIKYNTQNICNSDLKTSLPISCSYQVDQLPTVTGLTITGTPNPTEHGCTANSYTGNIANRTLTITVTGRDADGISDINGLSLWLVKRGVGDLSNDINKILAVGPGATATSQTEIGVFLGDPSLNPAQELTVYKAINSGNTLTGWGRDVPTNPLGTKQVQDSAGNVLISSVSGTRRNLDSVTKEYVVTLEFPQNAPISGQYDIYAGFSDIFTYSGIGAATYLDSQNVKQTTSSWNFDFTNPTVSVPVINSSGQQNLRIEWTADDTGSKIPANRTVVNVYKTGVSSPISATPGGLVEHIIEQPTESEIGNFNTPKIVSGWIHPAGGDGGRVQDVNIQTNDNGLMIFFISSYDLACNKSKSQPTQIINLNKWLATKGGIFYSRGSVNYPTKSGLSGQNYNLGTELTSSLGTAIGHIINYNLRPTENPAIARGVIDSNNNGLIFSKLKQNYEDMLNSGSLKAASLSGSTVTCDNPTGCYWNTDSIGDITYSGKIIAYSNKIRILNEIKKTNNSDVMFVFADNDITIAGTQNSTGPTIFTDKIDAFLLSGGSVTVDFGTSDAGQSQDQILVEGGVIGLANSNTANPAFILKRSLGLKNLDNPTLIINYHPKYAVESKLFFGLQVNAYKREVGFKPM